MLINRNKWDIKAFKVDWYGRQNYNLFQMYYDNKVFYYRSVIVNL